MRNVSHFLPSTRREFLRRTTSGIGLLASAHALAAVGGGGMLEVDANPNPLRLATCGPLATIVDGGGVLSNRPGLGIDPDLAGLQAYAVAL